MSHERPGHGVGTPVELCVSEGFASMNDSGAAWKAACYFTDALVQGGFDLPVGVGFVEGVDQTTSFGVGKEVDVPDLGIRLGNARYDRLFDMDCQFLDTPSFVHFLIVDDMEFDEGIVDLRSVRIGQEACQRNQGFAMAMDDRFRIVGIRAADHLHKGAGDEVGRIAEPSAKISRKPVVGVTLMDQGVADALAGTLHQIGESGIIIHVHPHGCGADEHAYGVDKLLGRAVGCARANNDILPPQGAGEDHIHGRQDHAERRYLAFRTVGKQRFSVFGAEAVIAGGRGHGCGRWFAGDIQRIGQGRKLGVPVGFVHLIFGGFKVCLFGIIGSV